MHASSSDLNRESISQNPDESELKRTLYESMKNSGVLGSLKSQLRSKLYDQLKIKADNSSKPSELTVQSRNKLNFKVAVSLCADLMKKCDMPYAMSVFLPECGFSHEILNKSELVEILALKSDDVLASQPDSTPLLLDIVERIKHNKSINAGTTSTSCQTEDIDAASLTIDQKL
jgi:hypothetical protein